MSESVLFRYYLSTVSRTSECLFDLQGIPARAEGRMEGGTACMRMAVMTDVALLGVRRQHKYDELMQ